MFANRHRHHRALGLGSTGRRRSTRCIGFRNGAVVVARILLAFIVGAVSFYGIYKQLANVDPNIRFWVALTQGFAVDALASPWAPET
jgi:hypothetical protein